MLVLTLSRTGTHSDLF
nr:hypothetical protein [Leptotrichia trevisanii]